MNSFDAVISAIAVVVVVTGYRLGLLRSLATILGYLIAAPLAVALSPYLIALAFGRAGASAANVCFIVILTFLALGIAISALLRTVVAEFIDPDVSMFDR